MTAILLSSCVYKEYSVDISVNISLHARAKLSLGYMLPILLDYRTCIPSTFLDTVKLLYKVVVPISFPLTVFDISHGSLDIIDLHTFCQTDDCELVYYFKNEFTWLLERLSIFSPVYWQIWYLLLWVLYWDCLPLFFGLLAL